MKRIVARLLVVVTLTTVFAGPVCAQQRPATKSSSSRNRFLWPAVVMIAGGAAMAFYGFHAATNTIAVTAVPGGTSGFVTTNTYARGVGTAGLAVAGVGGVLLFIGHGRGRPEILFDSPSWSQWNQTGSWKRVQLGEANLPLTFHEGESGHPSSIRASRP